MNEKIKTQQNPINDFSGDGEMGILISSKDWSSTPLGPLETWPDSLKFYLKLMLRSKYQMWMGWGPEYYKFYNEAYAPTLGIKHPESLGKSAKITWAEIWHVIGPMLDEVMSTGKALYYENLLLFLERHGFKEETYHTFSYSPLPDGNGGTGGVFCAVSEDTKKVLSQRRLSTLHDLSDSTRKAQTQEEVCFLSAEVLKKNPKDIPFALIYLFDNETYKVYLKATAGITHDNEFAPAEIDISDKDQDQWQFSEVVTQKQSRVVSDLSHINNIPKGPWDETPEKVYIQPILKSGQEQPAGFLVAGISSRLEFSEEYRNFLGLVSGQISTALANVNALEEERRRAEALAEIDKAKTVFFSNVSHEFRTPLTLMLGPLEEILNNKMLSDLETKEQIAVIHRNSLRLLKLVNSLLDFSRIEAGRIQAIYRETDIRQYTIDLSNSFRSAIESAGLKFILQAEEIKDPVYVDRVMWERIIFNLLSNALKFTLNGQISVSLWQEEDLLKVSIKDTGSGIPEEELPKLFTRFHRIENIQSRTHEGTGIGLAMVHELVKLHGGTITANSKLGKGTTFTVAIPVGSKHLPKDRITSSEVDTVSLNALPNLEEELFSMDIEDLTEINRETGEIPTEKEIILVADDNRDMRAYITKLLQSNYKVITVPDGYEALKEMEKEKPSLVLSDIMMPNLDGFGLLKRIRTDARYRNIPVILISARAGAEAKVEGIEAGADDYLVKPFQTKELLSRVRTNLETSKLKNKIEEERKTLYDLFMQAPAPVCILRGPEHTYELVNPLYEQVLGKRELLGKTIREALPELEGQGIFEILDKIYQTGETFVANEISVDLIREIDGKPERCYFNLIYQPLRNSKNQVGGIFVFAYEVTFQVLARERLAKYNQELTKKNEQLTRINNDLDNFIYTASHDLKAPVSNIEGLLNTLVDTLDTQTTNNPEFITILNLIEKSVTRFKNTILDLTEISKTQKETHDEINEINCAEIIEDVIFSIQESITESQATINTDLKCDNINFSKKNFKSIIYNLLSNAIKYRDPAKPLKVLISIRKENDYIYLYVKDNGLGINETNKSKLFTMFKRFHDHVEGTGIGLYIVKRIVDNAGGKIEVESTEGKGTCFKVILPSL